MSIHKFTVKSIDGQEVSLSDYAGKLVLIVNTASKCGFTPQYEELESLYSRYKDQGFVILGFPCNQFLNQEPESNEKIQEFCKLTYGVTFPMFAKVEVNGAGASPLFAYLTSQKPFQGFDFNHPIGKKLDEILSAENANYAESNDIKWNFTKFLVGKNGEVIVRYEPTTEISEIEDNVKRILNSK